MILWPKTSLKYAWLTLHLTNTFLEKLCEDENNVSVLCGLTKAIHTTFVSLAISVSRISEFIHKWNKSVKQVYKWLNKSICWNAHNTKITISQVVNSMFLLEKPIPEVACWCSKHCVLRLCQSTYSIATSLTSIIFLTNYASYAMLCSENFTLIFVQGGFCSHGFLFILYP